MVVFGLNVMTDEIGSSIRTYFAELIKNREYILNGFNKANLEMREWIVDNWDKVSEFSPFPMVQYGDLKFLLRTKKSEFKWIQDYDTAHLRNSVIVNLLLNEKEGDIRVRLDKVIFVYYSYWFMKKEGDINSLTHNVCFELQEIIKQLIQKELSLYRNYETASVIEAVRWRLQAENIHLLARVPSLNMRRS